MTWVRAITLALAVSFGAAGASFASSVEDQVVRQLRDQGFTQIELRRTLLGRIRVVAESADYRRELVLNPSTGVILRDYWDEKDDEGDRGGREILVPGRGDGNGGGFGGDDDDDDDDDADDDDDDNGGGGGDDNGGGGDDDD